MRTTLTIDDALYAEVRIRAAHVGCGIGSVVEDALRDYLARISQSQPAHYPPLPTFRSGGTLPGVDLNDMSSVRELIDEGLDPHARR